jgi:hypothetical protein
MEAEARVADVPKRTRSWRVSRRVGALTAPKPSTPWLTVSRRAGWVEIDGEMTDPIRLLG